MNDMTTLLPQPEQLGFGQFLGSHVVACEHTAAAGWSALQDLPLSTARMPIASGGVQYGFSVFEGLKAYRGPNGQPHLFRVRDHAARLARSAARLGLPEVPEALFVEACENALRVHEAIVPPYRRGSLYLRPTLAADEEALGFRVASRHRFSVVATPCSDPPLKTVRLWAERELTRAARGGLGEAKTGGNYAAGMLGLLRARERGYDDVAWLDAGTHSMLGEAGTMNLFVEIDGRLYTPPLDGTILAGITRDTLMGMTRAAERQLPLAELASLQRSGRLGTAFGVGTAARLVRIAEIGDGAGSIRFPDTGVAARCYARLKDVQEM